MLLRDPDGPGEGASDDVRPEEEDDIWKRLSPQEVTLL
jgi:hypothetical protein